MSSENKTALRLIILTQFYDPEPAYKGQEFAEAVRDLGYEVAVVTGFPNYPNGKVYPGYKIRPIQRTTQNGINIVRLALFPSHGGSRFGRVANYLSFFLSAFLYLSFAARKANLIYVYNPPLTAGLAAAASKLFHSCPVVVDIHDLWPDTLPATGMISNPRLLRWIGRSADWMYRQVDFILLHTNGFKTKLEERGVCPSKMRAVIGWTREQEKPSGNAEPSTALDAMRSRPGIKLLYAGNMGPAQALDSVLEAALMLQKQGEGDSVTICFLGDGIEKVALQAKAAADRLENVLFLPRVQPEAVGQFLASADALLVHLRASPLFEITLPSKTQAYMYAGKPILMAVGGEAAELVNTAKAGTTALSQNPESIASAALELANMPAEDRMEMGQSGRQYYLDHLCMRKGMEHFAEIFDRVSRTRSAQTSD